MPKTCHAKKVIRVCIGASVADGQLQWIAHMADHLNDRTYTPLQLQELELFFLKDASVYLSGLIVDGFITETGYKKAIDFMKEARSQMSAGQFTEREKTFGSLFDATVRHLLCCNCHDEAVGFLKASMNEMSDCEPEISEYYRDLLAAPLPFLSEA
jgi:hypothetical protein